jgi:hypothetical protein
MHSLDNYLIVIAIVLILGDIAIRVLLGPPV